MKFVRASNNIERNGVVMFSGTNAHWCIKIIFKKWKRFWVQS